MWSSHKLWLGRISLIIPFSLDRVLRTLYSWTGFRGLSEAGQGFVGTESVWALRCCCHSLPLAIRPLTNNPPTFSQRPKLFLTSVWFVIKLFLTSVWFVIRLFLTSYQICYQMSRLTLHLGPWACPLDPKSQGSQIGLVFPSCIVLPLQSPWGSHFSHPESLKVIQTHFESFFSQHWFITFWKFSLYKVHYNLKATFGQLHQ